MRISLFSLLVFITPLTAAPALSVGYGEADVSPEIGNDKPKVYLAGFGADRVATKLHDPIMVRGFVLSDGTKKIALISVDLVGLFLPSVDNVRAKLKGIDHVIVSSTHNHEGPDTVGLWGPSRLQSGVNDAYIKRVEEGIVKVIEQADKALQPAYAQIGKAKAPELLHDSRLPIVLHDDLVAIRFMPSNSDKPSPPIGILLQWNCHPEALGSKNTECSADFVGYTVEYLKKQAKCPVGYFTGTVGGLLGPLGVKLKDDKSELMKDGTFEKTQAYGEAVAKVAVKSLEKPEAITLVPFDIRVQTILVPVDNGLYRVAKQLGVLKRGMYSWEGTTTPKEFKEAKDITKPVAVKTEVGYLKLGDLDVAQIPGEIYPELVLDKIQTPADPGADFPDAPNEPAIYPAMKGKHKMLIGLANDELGYFIPKRQWDAKPPYCYGRKESQYGEINSCGPDTAKAICETFLNLTKK